MSAPLSAPNATASNDPGQAAAAAAAAILANIGKITGPMFLGHLFNWLLLGVLSLQVYIYSVSFRGDKLGIKLLVYCLFLFDVLQTAFATHYGWYVLAGGWGNIYRLNFTPWTLATIPPLSGLIALMVQGFFAWRIWILSQGNRIYYVPVFLIGFTAIGSCVAAWYAGVASGSMRNVAKAALLDPEVTAWLAGSLACDSMITLTLVWQLFQRRNEGFSAANHVVHRAIRMTVETGALTTCATIVELALFLNASVTSWYFMFGMLMAKLYSNSLLATLNSRSTTFQKVVSSSVSSGGAKAPPVWDIRAGESHPSFANTRRADIELGRVQQDMTHQYDSKPQDLVPDSTFASWK